MPLKALLSCFCLLIVMLQPTAGQEFNYRHYNERDGLVGPVVYSMVQDKEGFIWFATETGVSRFDGTRFRNFTTKDGLPNNEVIRIYCDSKGRVWLMPYKHAICYYQDGYIHTQRNDSLLKKLYLEGFVFCIEENKKGEVMLMDMSNVFLITPDDKVQYLTNMTTTGGAMTKLAVTTADKTWLMYRWSILEYSKGRFREVYKLPYGSVVSGGQVIMDDDLFCYVESSGQYRIHAKKYNLDYLVTSPAINTAERFNDSLILLNTSRGSVLFNILTRRNVTTYLPDKNVSNILRDREGNIWISTLNDGVYRISSDRFQNVLKTTPNNQKISVYGLAKQGGAIHVGTDVGYFRLRPIDGGFEITDDISINMPVTFVDSWRDVLLMCAGLRVFVKKGNAPMRYMVGDNATKFVSMKNEREAVVAGSNGIRIMDVHNMTGISERIGHVRASAVFCRNDSVYYGALNGLSVLVQPGNKVFSFADTSRLLQGSVRDIKEDNAGTMWVATDNGLIGMRGNRIVRHIAQADGLTSSNVRCIEVSDSLLWVGTDKGMNRVVLSGSQLHVTRYTQADGLASDIVNSILVDGDTIYAGTQEGITYFNRNLSDPYSRCDLRLLEVSINGRKADPANLPLLNYANNSIHLEYAALSYKSDGDIIYYYRLREQDSAWRQSRQTSLDLISLPPGAYHLELYAVNRFGLKSAVLTIPLTVKTPFWQSIWFVPLAAAVLIALTWALIYWRLGIRRKKENAERMVARQLQELEQKALRAQMNPHFIFNSLNAVQEFIIDQDMESANRYLSRFARLIRQTLDMSMQPNITVQDEVRYLRTYLELEQMRFDQRFNFAITVDPQINTEEALWPGMVLQPLVENAVQHGIRHLRDREGMITVAFRLEQRMIVCTVTDNGVGRNVTGSRPGGHVSWGTRITRERINMMNKSISSSIGIIVNDLPGESGTAVEVRYPLITG